MVSLLKTSPLKMLSQADALVVMCFSLAFYKDANAFVYHGRWSCPPEFEGRCIKILPPTTATFAGAQNACQNIGANLVSINSFAQNGRVYRTMTFDGIGGVGTSVWIGAFRENGDEPFQWIDGAPFDYTNWSPGQPDNSTGNEFCVELITDGHGFGEPETWNDIPCDTEIHNWIYCELAREDSCGQLGFHVMTQMTNTIGAVDWAIDHGANGIQMDLQIDADGDVVNFRHGAPCDCCCYCGLLPMFCNGTSCNDDSICAALIVDSPGAPCDASTAADELLEYVANKTGVVTVVIRSQLAENSNETIQTIAGQNAAQVVIDHLFDPGYSGFVIFTVDYTSHVTFLQAVAARVTMYIQYADKIAVAINLGTGPGGELNIVDTIAAEQTIPASHIAYEIGTHACNPAPNWSVLYSEDTRKLAAYNEAKGVVGLSFTWTVDDEDAIVHSFRYYHGLVTSFPGKVVSLAQEYDITLARPCTLLGGSDTDFCNGCNVIPQSTTTDIVSSTDEYDCACTYHSSAPSGCTITAAAPPNTACYCDKVWVGLPLPVLGGHWKCTGTAVACRNPLSSLCANPDTSKESCDQGFGDCDGYP